MRYIGKSKIGKLHPKRSKIYPMVRLPEQCLDVAGETVRIYSVEMEGVRGFFIALETGADEERNVAQLLTEVAQPRPQNDVKSRLVELESDINALKSLLFSNESEAFTKIKNRWARPNSNRRPSPCKGGEHSA